jgi:hypothetical protein
MGTDNEIQQVSSFIASLQGKLEATIKERKQLSDNMSELEALLNDAHSREKSLDNLLNATIIYRKTLQPVVETNTTVPYQNITDSDREYIDKRVYNSFHDVFTHTTYQVYAKANRGFPVNACIPIYQIAQSLQRLEANRLVVCDETPGGPLWAKL